MGSHPDGREGDEKVEVQGVGAREMGDLEREIFLQVELYADEDNDSVEIKRKKRMARTALAMWKERMELGNNRILQKESEMRRIMNEVYNLVSMYSVFVGVVLTAVATSSRLECQHLWGPVGLSSFAYSVLVVIAFTKFQQISILRWMNRIEGRALKEIVKLVYYLRRRGYADFDFDRDCPKPGVYRVEMFPGGYLWRSALVFIVSLTIFTMGLVFSLVHILCWTS